MRFTRSVQSLRSLVTQIKRNLLDLQPNFQRGEVWNKPKQQCLIDSILRGWYVPPIHLVQLKDGKREVLDGQQRLRAILEFVQGEFEVDGTIEPKEARLESLDGVFYSSLPKKQKRSFHSFEITVFTLTEYGPAEPVCANVT